MGTDFNLNRPLERGTRLEGSLNGNDRRLLLCSADGGFYHLKEGGIRGSDELRVMCSSHDSRESVPYRRAPSSSALTDLSPRLIVFLPPTRHHFFWGAFWLFVLVVFLLVDHGRGHTLGSAARWEASFRTLPAVFGGVTLTSRNGGGPSLLPPTRHHVSGNRL